MCHTNKETEILHISVPIIPSSGRKYSYNTVDCM